MDEKKRALEAVRAIREEMQEMAILRREHRALNRCKKHFTSIRRFVSQTADDSAVVREWQPIETAPKDGKAFLAAIPDFNEPMLVAMKTLTQTVGDEDREYRGFCIDTYSVSHFDAYDEVHPTHWMPLPAPPRIEQATQSADAGKQEGCDE